VGDVGDKSVRLKDICDDITIGYFVIENEDRALSYFELSFFSPPPVNLQDDPKRSITMQFIYRISQMLKL
jgi:hypothetical protein